MKNKNLRNPMVIHTKFTNAAKAMFTTFDDIPPIYATHGKAGFTYRIAEINSDTDMADFITEMRADAIANTPETVCFIFEGLSMEVDNTKNLAPQIRALENSDDSEYLHIYSEFVGASAILTRFRIHRDADDKPYLGDAEIERGSQFGGSFVPLLPAKPPTAVERAIAKGYLQFRAKQTSGSPYHNN